MRHVSVYTGCLCLAGGCHSSWMTSKWPLTRKSGNVQTPSPHSTSVCRLCFYFNLEHLWVLLLHSPQNWQYLCITNICIE